MIFLPQFQQEVTILPQVALAFPPVLSGTPSLARRYSASAIVVRISTKQPFIPKSNSTALAAAASRLLLARSFSVTGVYLLASSVFTVALRLGHSAAVIREITPALFGFTPSPHMPPIPIMGERTWMNPSPIIRTAIDGVVTSFSSVLSAGASVALLVSAWIETLRRVVILQPRFSESNYAR